MENSTTFQIVSILKENFVRKEHHLIDYYYNYNLIVLHPRRPCSVIYSMNRNAA